MHRLCILAFALASILLAQGTTMPGTTPIFSFEQTFSTGMFGFTTNQAARLTVLNLNAVPTTTTTTTTVPNCSVELQLLDEKGTVVKSATVANFAPGAVTSLDVPRSAVTTETAARAEIRGVVTINPPSSSASPVAAGYCSVFTTLEIFDSTTGSTVAATSDTRAISRFVMLTTTPMPMR